MIIRNVVVLILPGLCSKFYLYILYSHFYIGLLQKFNEISQFTFTGTYSGIGGLSVGIIHFHLKFSFLLLSTLPTNPN